MRVKRRLPFRYSAISLAILCCTLAQHSALADEGPAVLQFARKYQQQATPPQEQPAYNPALKPKAHAEKGSSPSSAAKQQQRAALHNQLVKSKQQLYERGQQLLKLQQQISQLKSASAAQPAAQIQVPSLSEADRQTLQNVATTFSNLWHLSPSEAALAEKLRQTGQQVQQSQQRSKRSRQRQQELQQQLNVLRDRYTALLRRDAAGSNQQQATAQQQAELEQQISALNEVKSRMQQQLADSLLRSKTAEAQLDSVLAQQKSSNTIASQASATLLAGKQAAEEQLKTLQADKHSATEKLKALQSRLDEALAQQKSSNTITSQASATLLAGKQAAEEQLKTLQADKHSAAEKLKALQSRLDEALAQQKSSNTITSQASATLLAGKQAAEEQLKTLQADKHSAAEKLKALQSRLDELLAQQAKQPTAGKSEVADLTAAQLKQKTTREAYAIGFSLGHQILQVQAENHNWSAVDNDRRVVLAGIVDAFKNKAKIPLAELEKTLTAVTTRLNSGREKFMNHLDSSTKNFVSAFIKDKNTHKSDLGFWYRVSYIGDTPIPANASIDVVVKESLANGKVIEDMDVKGIVLTQPLSAFPPVFREALSKIKNHGSVTIVVPPKLAYGEKGYPPKVPPNATMVYDIRIAELYPEKKKPSLPSGKKVSPESASAKSKTGLK